MQWRRGKAYSQDLRERVFALCDAGDAVGEIADALVCQRVLRVEGAQPEAGHGRNIGASTALPHVPPKLFGLYDAIRAEVASRPDATLAELRRWLGEVHRRFGQRRADARHARQARADA